MARYWETIMSGRFLIAVLLVLCLGAVASPCQAQHVDAPMRPAPDRVRIEKAMREYQARYQYLKQAGVLSVNAPDAVPWPNCDVCGDGVSSPYPRDGLYGEELSAARSAELVGYLKDQFFSSTYKIYDKLYKLDVENLAIDDLKPATHVAGDFSDINVTVTTSNYKQVFDKLLGHIQALSYIEVVGVLADKMRRQGPAGSGTTCALSKADGKTKWTNDTPESFTGSQSIQIFESLTTTNNGGTITYSSLLNSVWGKVELDLAAFDDSCYVYIRVYDHDADYTVNDTTNTPPVTADKKFRYIETLSGGSSESKTQFISGDDPDADFGGDCPADPGVDNSNTDTFGWYIHSQVALCRINFESKTDPRDCIVGGCADGGCNPGDVTLAVNSAHITINLGAYDQDTGAGALVIDADVAGAALSTPSMLHAVVSTGVEVIRVSNDVRQVKTGQVLADVVVPVGETDLYEIRFYKDADLEAEKVDDLYVPLDEDNWYRKVIIDAPGGNTSKLRITEISGPDPGTTLTVSQYEWDANVSEWLLMEGYDTGSGDFMRAERHEESWTGDVRTEFYEVLDSSSTVIYKERTKYERFDWGEEIIEHVVDPAGEALTWTWSYYDDEENDPAYAYSKLKHMTEPFGYWEHYEYDYDDVNEEYETTIVMQYENGVWDAGDVVQSKADNIVVTRKLYWQELDDPADGAEVFTETVEKVQDTSKAKRYTVDWSGTESFGGDSCFVRWGIVCTDPADAWDDEDNLVTIRYAFSSGDHKHDAKGVVNPGGTMSVMSYASGTHAPFGTVETLTIDRGIANGTGTAVQYGTRQVIKVTTDASTDATYGAKVFDETYPIRSGSANTGIVFSSRNVVEATDIDDFGRVLEVEYTDGTTSAVTYGCCGVTSRTDRRGLVTLYSYDELQRLTEMTVADGTAGERITSYEYDAMGRRIETYRGASNDGNRWLLSAFSYDAVGRVIKQTDAEGTNTFFTYGTYVDTDPDPDLTYQEHRVYPHGPDLGTIRINWIDSHGRTVWSMTAAADDTATWNGGSPPNGTEAIDEISRTVTDFDWRGLVTAQRRYHNLASLLLGEEPIASVSDFYYESTVEYDFLGRPIRTTDGIGDITARVYDDGGRVLSVWRGTNSTGATPDDPDGAGGANDMKMVARVFYDADRDGTGELRPFATRRYRVKALASAPDAGDLANDYTYTDFDQGEGTTSRWTWTMPEDGLTPWLKQVSNLHGQLIETKAYENGETDAVDETYLLAKSSRHYDTGNSAPWRLIATRQYEIGTSNFLETTYAYDDAERLVKVTQPDGAFTKTQFDGEGRVLRTWVATDEGADGDVTDAVNDTVISASEYIYDKVGNVLAVTNYAREHDDTTTGGMLTTGNSYYTVAVNWYDDGHNLTHSVNYGTDPDNYVYDATGALKDTDSDGIPNVAENTPPEPDSSDDYIVTKFEFDWLDHSSGHGGYRVDTITDNGDIQTRSISDALGRQVYLVENYDNFSVSSASTTIGGVNGIEDRTTAFVYNAVDQVIEQTAMDPSGDGNATFDDQITLYVYSSELNNKGGPVKSNGYLRAIIYPDSNDYVDGAGALQIGDDILDGLFDRIEFTYYADGSVATRKDQREIELTYAYDAAGRLIEQEVTGGTPDGDVQVKYTFTDRGELEKVTTYSTADTTISSEVKFAYNGYGQLTKDEQDHDSAVDGASGDDPQSVQYTYDGAKANRLDYVTYPNTRDIHMIYDAGISDKLSRVAAISDASTRGMGDANVIADYEYLGLGTVVVKDMPVPAVRLDYFGGTPGTYDGIDRFGRVTKQRWIDHSGSDIDVWHAQHGYDRNSNRTFSARQIYTSNSEVYGYDEHDRLTEYKQGLIKSDHSAIVDNWVTDSSRWTLDQLGNQAQVEHWDPAAASWQTWTEHDHNDANEIEERRVRGDTQKRVRGVDTFAAAATETLWDKPDDVETTDTFDINNNAPGKFYFDDVEADDYDGETEEEPRAFFLFGGAIGEPDVNNTTHVFGFNGDPNDYYLSLGGSTYKVTDGQKAADAMTDGYPGGRVGLYATASGDVADFYEFGRGLAMAMTDRWSNYQTGDSEGGKINSSDRLDLKRPTTTPASSEPHLILLRNVRARYFQATFAVRDATSTGYHVSFVFNAKDEKNYDIASVWVPGQMPWGAAAPSGAEVIDGTKTGVSSTVANAPSYGGGGVLWYCVRVFKTGGTDTLEISAGTSAANAISGTVIYRSTDYNFASGQIGFAIDQQLPATVDDLEIRLDRNADGDFSDPDEVVHSFDPFFIDASGYGSETLEYDRAGNLTYDGLYQYTYDAWNRLVEVHTGHDDTDSDGDAEVGSQVAAMRYDGLGRRIVASITTGGDASGSYTDLDGTYHYYYDGHRLVELRDGSELVLQHFVWGAMYIDELLQIGVNDDPATDDHIDVNSDFYYALHNASFNVMALVDDVGAIVERYEYTPYGRRQVYVPDGVNDAGAFAAAPLSQRVVLGGTAQAYSLNPFGHQGLHHDESTGLVYNRARMLSPRIGRFMQRDPLGYVDGMSLFVAYSILHGIFDPLGLESHDPLPLFWMDSNNSFNVDVAPVVLYDPLVDDYHPTLAINVTGDGFYDLVAEQLGCDHSLDRPSQIDLPSIDYSTRQQASNDVWWGGGHPPIAFTYHPEPNITYKRPLTLLYYVLPDSDNHTVYYTDGTYTYVLGSPTAFESGVTMIGAIGAKNAVGVVKGMVGLSPEAKAKNAASVASQIIEGGSRGFTDPAERSIAEFLEGLGRKVDKNALEGVSGYGRQADGFVDGVRHEFKTLDPGATHNTLKNAVTSGMGQARNIVVDARNSGLDLHNTLRGIARLKGLPGNRIDNVTVIGDDFFLNFPMGK